MSMSMCIMSLPMSMSMSMSIMSVDGDSVCVGVLKCLGVDEVRNVVISFAVVIVVKRRTNLAEAVADVIRTHVFQAARSPRPKEGLRENPRRGHFLRVPTVKQMSIRLKNKS
jgi:hypothetical protein